MKQLFVLLAAAQALGASYTINEEADWDAVPWGALVPGDAVAIAWRAAPYPRKWVLCVAGTAEQPISIRGIPGPEGQRPAITGIGAKTPAGQDFWNEDRGILKIGGANSPPDRMPKHIRISGLDLSGANPHVAFHGRDGRTEYRRNAAAIYIEKGEDILIENCLLHNCANGLVSSWESRQIVVRNCTIQGNGVVRSVYQHNVYTESQSIAFERNRFGPLRPGAPGNNIKDRSANTIVRYNRIEGGNRLLDLVETSHQEIATATGYGDARIYGNILIKQNDTSNRQVIHFGGDGKDHTLYRNGTLSLVNNTIVADRRVKLCRLHATGVVIGWNNIIQAHKGSSLVEGGRGGFFACSWISDGIETGNCTLRKCWQGKDPGLDRSFRLRFGSPCRDRACNGAPPLMECAVRHLGAFGCDGGQ